MFVRLFPCYHAPSPYFRALWSIGERTRACSNYLRSDDDKANCTHRYLVRNYRWDIHRGGIRPSDFRRKRLELLRAQRLFLGEDCNVRLPRGFIDTSDDQILDLATLKRAAEQTRDYARTAIPMGRSGGLRSATNIRSCDG